MARICECADMSRARQLMPTVFSITDKYTSLLMHMDGVNNGGVFLEETGKTVTRVGTPITSNAQSVFGNSSLTGITAADHLTVENHNDFSLGDDDFTVECWIRVPNLSGRKTIMCHRQTWNGYHSFSVSLNNQQIYFQYGTPDAANTDFYFNFAGAYALKINTWLHIAIVRNGGSIKGYCNGGVSGNIVNIGTKTLNTPRNPLRIGAANDNAYLYNPFVGYIDEVRISKGIARYTSNFTPPTEPFMR